MMISIQKISSFRKFIKGNKKTLQSSAKMKIKFAKPYSFTQLGRRNSQEDYLVPVQADESNAFFVVCDGVGGREHGEVASELVCQSFEHSLADDDCHALSVDDVLNLVDKAYDTLYCNRAICPEMATTLTFMARTDEGVLVAHIGDSRIYQVRRGGGVVFRTKDHSLVSELLNSGQITQEEAVCHPQRNVITRCLYVAKRKSERYMPSIVLIRDVQPHDIFMLCTDGVYSMFSDDDFTEILSSDATLEEKTAEIAAISSRSDDNNTAYLVEVADVEGHISNGQNIAYEVEMDVKNEKTGLWSGICRILGI